MRGVSAFIEVLSDHWWAVIGSGAFTFLGIFVLIIGTTPPWTVYGSFASAVVMVGIAAYRAWSEEHNRYLAELSRNSQPEIRGEYFNEGRAHNESGETVFHFHLSLCNQRPQPTTVKHVILTLSGAPLLKHQPRELFMALQPPGHGVRLERGIEAVIECTASVRTTDAMFLARMRVRVVDALWNEYDIPRRATAPLATT